MSFTINEFAGKPRKGRTLLHYSPASSELRFALNTSNFIASIEHWARGMTTYSVIASDGSSFIIELVREFETVDVGDRRYRIDMDISFDDGASGIESVYSRRFDRKVSKEFIISYRTDLNVLTVYLGGRAIDIEAVFTPVAFEIIEDSEEGLRDIRFFSLYVPSVIEDTIPIIWRKWYKDSVETGSGYSEFAQSFRAIETGGNRLFGPDHHWDALGLYVDPPEPEDFDSREQGLMTAWPLPADYDSNWDFSAVEII